MSHVNEKEWLDKLRENPEEAKYLDLNNMSNRYIREFADYVNWYMISGTKNMGIDFMREFADRLDLTQVWRNKHIKAKAREEILKILIEKDNLDLITFHF